MTPPALRPNDPLPESIHYRGTKVRVNPKGEVWWQSATLPNGERIMAVSGHEELARTVLASRPDGGSCRLSEALDILTKSDETDPDWQPYWLGELGEPVLFKDVDVLGKGLKPGDIWTAFYDGAVYSFAGNRVWWSNPRTGGRHLVKESLPPKILAKLRELKPEGGRFRITENGKVLTLIAPQPLSDDLKRQFDAMNPTQRTLLVVKTASTRMLPVYVGDMTGGLTIEPVKRLTDPLSEAELKEFDKFLSKFSFSKPPQQEFPEFDDVPEVD